MNKTYNFMIVLNEYYKLALEEQELPLIRQISVPKNTDDEWQDGYYEKKEDFIIKKHLDHD